MSQLTSWQYFLWVFIAAIGVVQLAAARSRLRGLLFFKREALAYLFALLAIGGSYGWFFGWDRLDTVMRKTGLEGSQQFLYFFLGTLAAGGFTLVVSSLLQAYLWNGQSKGKGSGQGLDALKEMSYFQAIRQSFKGKKGKLNDSSG
jgi:hypothetical protein